MIQNTYLNGISLKINKGDRIAIIGQSGSGQIYLSLLIGLIPPSSGQIIINGINIGEFREADISVIGEIKYPLFLKEFIYLKHLSKKILPLALKKIK